MSFAAVLILAVSLSMDALGIGISYGLRGIRVSWKARVVICAMSMMVTGAAVGLGSVLLEVIPLPAAKLLGCGMLLFLGLVIIVQGFRKRKEENSFSCDFDRSKAIETAEALYLGAALSVDSFGAGVSSAVSGMNSILVPILAGLMQMLTGDSRCGIFCRGFRLQNADRHDSTSRHQPSDTGLFLESVQ